MGDTGMTGSYNGWPASTSKTAIGVNANAVAYGTNVKFPGGVKHGDVETVLMYVAGEVNRRVEKLAEGCWGYNYRQNRNANNLSCHASGTAIDINAPRHPNGKSGTFNAKQVAALRQILKEAGGVVKWGGDFGGTKDEMHFEIHGDAAAVKRAATNIINQRHKPVAPPARPPAKPTPAWFKRTLRQGMTSPKYGDVWEMQAHLHMAHCDGEFGPLTLAAVKHVQQAHGIKPTGVVDVATAKQIG